MQSEHHDASAFGQQGCPICFQQQPCKNKLTRNELVKGRCVMAGPDFVNMPRGNPCAQCGKPIAAPDWVEADPHRASYLWHCHACDYTFEAVAFFDDKQREPLAA
jgi:hypothetical protein